MVRISLKLSLSFKFNEFGYRRVGTDHPPSLGGMWGPIYMYMCVYEHGYIGMYLLMRVYTYTYTTKCLLSLVIGIIRLNALHF